MTYNIDRGEETTGGGNYRRWSPVEVETIGGGNHRRCK